MTRPQHLGAGILALAFAACGGSKSSSPGPDQEYADAVPNTQGLTLELEGDEATALAAGEGSTRQALAAGDFHQPSVGELADAKDRLRKLNTVVRGVLDRVNDVIGAQPSALPGNVRVFGPKDLPAAAPAASFRLTSKKKGAGHFAFKLEAKKLADPDADASYKLVAAGDLTRGNEKARRGKGTIAIDADALNSLNASAYPATGKLLASFVHTGENGKALSYRLDKFDADGGAGTTYQPVTGKIVGYKSSATGLARVRLVGFGDLVTPNVNPLGTGFYDELVVSRFGWNPAAGKARAYTLATNYVDAASRTHGDVSQVTSPAPAANAFWFGRACWQNGAKQYQDWIQCKWGQSGATCATEVLAQVLATNTTRYVKDAALPGGNQLWEQACQGVAEDSAPTLSDGSEPTSNAEDGAEADPGEPPAAPAQQQPIPDPTK